MLGLAFAEGGDDVDHDESGIGHGLEGPVFQECLGLEAAKEALAEHIVVAISGRANALAQSSRLDSGAEEAAGALAAPAGVMDGADADDSACRGAPQGGQQEDAGPEGAGDSLFRDGPRAGIDDPMIVAGYSRPFISGMQETSGTTAFTAA